MSVSVKVTPLLGAQLLHDAVTRYWPGLSPSTSGTDAVPLPFVGTIVAVIREDVDKLAKFAPVGVWLIENVTGTPLIPGPTPTVSG